MNIDDTTDIKNICKHKNVHKDSEITDELEHNSIPLNCGAYDSFLLWFFLSLVITYDLQCRPKTLTIVLQNSLKMVYGQSVIEFHHTVWHGCIDNALIF